MENESLLEALENVCNSIVKRANEESKKSEPWKELFDASEQGLISLLNKADMQMMETVLSTATIITDKFGIRCSDKLFDLLKALPFVMNRVTNEIEKQQGMSCCADKARRVYYEEVLSEIERLRNGTN